MSRTLRVKLTALITVVLLGQAATQRCSKTGIFEGSNKREFRICSENDQGQLTLKTFTCDESSVFSPSSKGCVPEDPDSEHSKELHPNPEELHSGVASYSHSPGVESYNDGGGIAICTQEDRANGGCANVSDSTPIVASYSAGSTQPFSPSTLLHSSGFQSCSIVFGRFCDSCTRSVACVNWRAANIQDCPGCDPYKNQCTNVVSNECNAVKSIKCSTRGLFPDPYFCNRYHMCLRANTASDVYACQPGQVYNSVIEHCQINMKGIHHAYTPCPSIPRCRSDMQSDIVRGNSRLFYVCFYIYDTNDWELSFQKCGPYETATAGGCVRRPMYG